MLLMRCILASMRSTIKTEPLRTIVAHFLSVSFRTAQVMGSLSNRPIAVGELSNHIDIGFSRGLSIVHNEVKGRQFLFLEEGFVPVRLILISTIPFSEMNDLPMKKLKSLVKEGHVAYYGIPWFRRAQCFVHLYDLCFSAVAEDGFFTYRPCFIGTPFLPVFSEKDPSYCIGNLHGTFKIIYFGENDNLLSDVQGATEDIGTLRFHACKDRKSLAHVLRRETLEIPVVLLGSKGGGSAADIALIRHAANGVPGSNIAENILTPVIVRFVSRHPLIYEPLDGCDALVRIPFRKEAFVSVLFKAILLHYNTRELHLLNFV